MVLILTDCTKNVSRQALPPANKHATGQPPRHKTHQPLQGLACVIGLGGVILRFMI